MQGIQWKDVFGGQESNCPGILVQCENAGVGQSEIKLRE